MASINWKTRLLFASTVALTIIGAFKIPSSESQNCVECVTLASNLPPEPPVPPTPTIPITPTRTITPNTQNSCALKLTVDMHQFSGLGVGLKVNPKGRPAPAWFTNMMQQAHEVCTQYLTPYLKWGYDDCVGASLGIYVNRPNPRQPNGPLLNIDYWQRKLPPVRDPRRGPLDPEEATTYLNYETGEQYPSLPPGMQICSIMVYFMLVSPVSLVMDPVTDINENITFTQFDLDQSKPGRWFIWKASGKTPLVVYDPDHKGIINSATQLFGNWTFGGKKLASLSTLSSVQAGPWRDGYEAMESLDANEDKKLSDEELTPLALWFDENQDGVSQAGEVKTLTDVGITALYFNSDSRDPSTNDLHASKGYDRIVNGKTVTGRSVDWYSDAAESKEALMNKIIMLAKMRKASAPSSNSFAKIPEPVENVTDQVPSEQRGANGPSIAGMWHWESENSEINSILSGPSGYMTFSEDDAGTIFGRSYGYSTFDSSSSAPVMLMALQLEGSIDKSDPRKIAFTVNSHAITLNNNATLSEDGNSLTGRTSAEIDYEGKKTKIFYTWKATRMPSTEAAPVL